MSDTQRVDPATGDLPAEQLCWRGSPNGGTACDRAAGHGGRHSWELLDTLPVEALAAMVADLDGYIERKATEIAQPLIDQANTKAQSRIEEAHRDTERQEALVAELRRQMKYLERRFLDRHTEDKITAALAVLPRECQYHGDQLDRDGAFPGVCCDTGKPARDRRDAEAALRALAERATTSG